MGLMCIESVLLPIPQFIKDSHRVVYGFDYEFPADCGEYGIDAQGQECFAIDKCIAPALLAVWKQGVVTTGCCCGHGSGSGIIGLATWEDKTNKYEASGMRAVHELRRAQLGPPSDESANLARQIDKLLPQSNITEIHPAAQAIVRFDSVPEAIKEIRKLEKQCNAAAIILNVIVEADKRRNGN